MIEDDLATNTCSATFFCGAGIDNVSTNPTLCGYGKMCPANAMEEVACDAGYY
jgi:hypothetical protein